MSKETVAMLESIEKQLSQARSRVTTAKNELIEAIDEMNKLQLFLQKKQIELLQAERDKK